MRHAPFIADAQFVPPKPSLAFRRARKSIFAVIIEAIRYSRRLQAERFLREHRDLIDGAQRSILREFHSREEAERCWRDLGSGRRPDL